MWVLKSIQCYSWLITWNFTIHQDAYFQIRFYLIFLETVDWKRILLSLLSLFIVVINHISYSIIFIAIILFVSTILMIVSVIIVFIYIWFYYFIMWSWWVVLLAPPYQVWFDSKYLYFSIFNTFSICQSSNHLLGVDALLAKGSYSYVLLLLLLLFVLVNSSSRVLPSTSLLFC